MGEGGEGGGLSAYGELCSVRVKRGKEGSEGGEVEVYIPRGRSTTTSILMSGAVSYHISRMYRAEQGKAGTGGQWVGRSGAMVHFYHNSRT